MKILVVNCGSSSLKYQLIDMENESVIAKGICERVGIEGSFLTHKPAGKDVYHVEKDMPDHKVAVEMVLEALVDPVHGVISSTDEIGAIGHRVLHAGQKYSGSVIATEDVKKVVRECFDLGPLHNPANLIGIEACEAAMPGKTNVAVFDTAFGQGMAPEAYMYAIPYEYYEKYGIRRYGFHGTSHDFVSHETINFLNLDPEKAKVIVCHLGNGGSISASIGGKCVDTSMGLTPLEGLVMGTRSGDIDPTVVQYICNKENKTVDEAISILNKKSGLLGLSGISSDFRDVKAKFLAGDERAIIAINTFIYRVVKYIGSYVAALDGVDAIAFTAGIGENGDMVRKMVCERLTYLGIKLDSEVNDRTFGEEVIISTPDSKVTVAVVPTNEELAIARETLKLI